MIRLFFFLCFLFFSSFSFSDTIPATQTVQPVVAGYTDLGRTLTWWSTADAACAAACGANPYVTSGAYSNCHWTGSVCQFTVVSSGLTGTENVKARNSCGGEGNVTTTTSCAINYSCPSGYYLNSDGVTCSSEATCGEGQTLSSDKSMCDCTSGYKSLTYYGSAIVGVGSSVPSSACVAVDGAKNGCMVSTTGVSVSAGGKWASSQGLYTGEACLSSAASPIATQSPPDSCLTAGQGFITHADGSTSCVPLSDSGGSATSSSTTTNSDGTTTKNTTTTTCKNGSCTVSKTSTTTDSSGAVTGSTSTDADTSGEAYDWPDDYANSGNQQKILNALTEPGTDYGDDPSLPTSDDVSNSLFQSSALSALTGWQLPSHSSVCPTASFSAFSHTFTFDAHCTIADSIRDVLRAAFIAAWAIIAMILVFKA